MVRTQYNKQVKKVRSDNAWEFDDRQCREFYGKLGILHETSCVDNPQQNGRAERRHRNLLEMGRALRFQSGLPLKYWGDYIMTATFLTNRLPSAVLGHQTPFEVLHSYKPDYTRLKSFGCLVIAVNPDRTSDKFKPKGVPCVFIGYPKSQKGYKLLNLVTNMTFVSRDVKFYEQIYPYRVFKPNSKQTSPFSLSHLHQFDDFPEDNVSTESCAPGPSCEPTNTAATNEEPTVSQPPPDTHLPHVRHSSRSHNPPSWLNDYYTGHVSITPTPAKISTTIPTYPSSSFSCFLSQLAINS